MEYSNLSDEHIKRAWDLCQKVFDFMDKNEEINGVKSLALEYVVMRLNKARKDIEVNEEIIRMIGTERSDKEDD